MIYLKKSAGTQAARQSCRQAVVQQAGRQLSVYLLQAEQFCILIIIRKIAPIAREPFGALVKFCPRENQSEDE